MEKSINHLLSETISFLRFPLIVGVVFIHTSIDIPVELVGSSMLWNFVESVMYYFSQVLPTVCVPLFFFISGFLFFYNSDFSYGVYKKKLTRRLKTLCVPYVIWSLVGFAVLMLRMNINWPYSLSPSTISFQMDFSTFLNCFFMISPSESTPPLNFPLWFIRDLIVMVCVCPIIYWLVKPFGFFFIFVLGFIWFFQAFNSLHFPEASYQSLFFFPLGAYYSIHKIDFVSFACKANWSIPLYILFSLADLFCRNESYGLYVHHVGILCGMICLICITSSLLDRQKIRRSKFLNEVSFFVFVTYGLFITKVEKLLGLVIVPQLPLTALSLYFFVPCFTISICMGFYVLLRNLVPNVLKVMVGGR